MAEASKDGGANDEWLYAVVDYDILPAIEEYRFDDPDSASVWDVRLFGVCR